MDSFAGGEVEDVDLNIVRLRQKGREGCAQGKRGEGGANKMRWEIDTQFQSSWCLELLLAALQRVHFRRKMVGGLLFEQTNRSSSC